MYSFIINIAIDVNKAAVPDTIIPAPGLIKPIVQVLTAEALATSISVVIDNTFFLFKLLYFFL